MKFSTIIFNFYFILVIMTTQPWLIQSGSFLDIAKEQAIVYNSEEYKNEAASLNPEYYTDKGKDELTKCRIKYKANFDKCRRLTTCNFCSANNDCGWCNEKKICIPIDLNSKKDQMIPLCQGDCIRILQIEFCYKGLFEPENTPEEINFATYPQVIEEPVNIFDAALEKNILNERESSLNLIKFKQKEENCDTPNPPISVKDGVNLNYDPNAWGNLPAPINYAEHKNKLSQEMTNISKNVFKNMISNVVDTKNYEMIQPDLDDKKVKEEMFHSLKNYIPNFEFPQFVKSDLEDSIDRIKREKLKLWLRGYSLNDDISKCHLPIYKNLTFVNEDQARKMLLDKFYRSVVRDPYSNIHSKVYKNLIGEQDLFGNTIAQNYEKKEAKKQVMRFKENNLKRIKTFKDIALELKEFSDKNL